MNRASVLFGCLMAAGFGCTTSNRPPASVHVTVQSITPWDDIKTSLEPQFKIDTGDEAMNAIPVTAAYRGALLRGYFAALRVALPQLGGFLDEATRIAEQSQDALTKSASEYVFTADGDDKSRKRTTSDSESNESKSSTKDTTKNTTTDRSGDLSKDTPATSGDGRFKDAKAAGLLAMLGQDGKLTLTPGTPGVLTYLAALSQYEMVRLLNIRTRDAALEHHGRNYRYFVVQSQISLMPHDRDSDWDTFVDITLFSHGSRGGDPEPVQILPILATDSLEASEQGRVDQLILKSMIAASGGFGGASGTAEFESLYDRIQQGLGRSYNSLVTMGRLTNNTVRVRIGAFQTVRAGQKGGASPDQRIMVPRTQTAAFLIAIRDIEHVKATLVAECSFSRDGMVVAADTTIRESPYASGTIRRERMASQAARVVEELTGVKIDLKSEPDRKHLAELVAAVQFGQMDHAKAMLKALSENTPPSSAPNADVEKPESPNDKKSLQSLLTGTLSMVDGKSVTVRTPLTQSTAALLWLRLSALQAESYTSFDTFDLPKNDGPEPYIAAACERETAGKPADKAPSDPTETVFATDDESKLSLEMGTLRPLGAGDAVVRVFLIHDDKSIGSTGHASDDAKLRFTCVFPSRVKWPNANDSGRKNAKKAAEDVPPLPAVDAKLCLIVKRNGRICKQEVDVTLPSPVKPKDKPEATGKPLVMAVTETLAITKERTGTALLTLDFDPAELKGDEQVQVSVLGASIDSVKNRNENGSDGAVVESVPKSFKTKAKGSFKVALMNVADTVVITATMPKKDPVVQTLRVIAPN